MGAPPVRVIDSVDHAADVVETLERALEKARAGELSSVAIAYVYRSGAAGYTRSAMPSAPAMLGAITRLQHRVLHSIDQDVL